MPLIRIRVRNPLNPFRIAQVFSLVAAVSAGGTMTATAAGDDPVAKGHALVETYCSRCHATEITGDGPLSAAPKLRELYLRYDVELLSEALVEGIVTAHPDMLQFQFDPIDAEAIIAYLKSLER